MSVSDAATARLAAAFGWISKTPPAPLSSRFWGVDPPASDREAAHRMAMAATLAGLNTNSLMSINTLAADLFDTTYRPFQHRMPIGADLWEQMALRIAAWAGWGARLTDRSTTQSVLARDIITIACAHLADHGAAVSNRTVRLVAACVTGLCTDSNTPTLWLLSAVAEHAAVLARHADFPMDLLNAAVRYPTGDAGRSDAGEGPCAQATPAALAALDKWVLEQTAAVESSPQRSARMM